MNCCVLSADNANIHLQPKQHAISQSPEESSFQVFFKVSRTVHLPAQGNIPKT